MKELFCRILTFLICLMLVPAVLSTGPAAAEEAGGDFLGKPFPDFTVTDTNGNAFTLSEVLKDHEAVLINFWATWCTPCRIEFPCLDEVYQTYSDRVAFIALSCESKDTAEKIAAYRTDNGLALPMAPEGDSGLYAYIEATSIPTTVVVDRFGNAVYLNRGTFLNAKEVKLVLDAFLGDAYTETTVMKAPPRDSSTRMLPVSAARAVYPENSSYRKVLLTIEGRDTDIAGYIIPDDSFRMRIELAADDNVSGMTYADMNTYKYTDVADLLDPELGVYVYNQAMPDASAETQFIQVAMADKILENDPKGIVLFLFRNEEAIGQLSEEVQAQGGPAFTWAYAEEEKKPESVLQAYVLHVMDQDNHPVGEVTVNFCTDTACVPKESEEDGTITFDGAPDVYHVQIIDGPDGYSWDEGFEMYTTREYGEWVLRVRKD